MSLARKVVFHPALARPRRVVRRLLGRSRDRAIAPILARVDTVSDSVTARLDDLSRRVSEIDQLVREIDARAAAVSERSEMAQEGQSQLAARLAEIEKLLEGDRAV